MASLTIGQVARRAGVNVQTLRYYERTGLLPEPPRGPSGYRLYPPETVDLIRFVKRAQELGFTLREIQELLALRDPAARGPCEEVRRLAEEKIAAIGEKIERLASMRSALEKLVRSCRRRSGPQPCPIIEALTQPPAPGSPPGRTSRRRRGRGGRAA
jgi:MerR family mercuric resistance operon transcriptional regulator